MHLSSEKILLRCLIKNFKHLADKKEFVFQSCNFLICFERKNTMERVVTYETDVKRLDYLDNVKAFAMVMIILGHSALSEFHPQINLWIQSFHVPIYFVISGIIFQRKEKHCSVVKYNFIKKVKSYLVPFYIFEFIFTSVISVILCMGDPVKAIQYFEESMVRMLMLDAYSASWFLPCIFITEIIFIFERHNWKLRTTIIINILLAVAALFVPHEILIVKTILRSFIGVFCFTCGYCLNDMVAAVERRKETKFFILVIIGIVYCVIVLVNGKTAAFDIEYGNYIFLYLPEIILGSCLIIRIFSIVANKSITFLTWFGRNTIIVLTTHQSIIEILWVIDGRIGSPLHALGRICPFVLCGIIMLIEIPVIWFCNHYIYFLFGRKKQVANT